MTRQDEMARGNPLTANWVKVVEDFMAKDELFVTISGCGKIPSDTRDQ